MTTRPATTNAKERARVRRFELVADGDAAVPARRRAKGLARLAVWPSRRSMEHAIGELVALELYPTDAGTLAVLSVRDDAGSMARVWQGIVPE